MVVIIGAWHVLLLSLLLLVVGHDFHCCFADVYWLKWFCRSVVHHPHTACLAPGFESTRAGLSVVDIAAC